MCTCTALYTLNVASLCTLLTPAFNVSLELQEGHCLDQITLICSDIPIDPNWIHLGQWSEVSPLALPFLVQCIYTVQSSTEHRVTISVVANEQTLQGGMLVVLCAYNIDGNLMKSNAVMYSFTSLLVSVDMGYVPHGVLFYVHMSMLRWYINVQPSTYTVEPLYRGHRWDPAGCPA